MRTSRTWKVQVAAAAERDFHEIIRWTRSRFGQDQARIYSAMLMSALRALRAGPRTPGVRARSELGDNLYTLHAAHGGRRARHLILFRISEAPSVVEVLRFLHDAMDLARHLPREISDEEGST
ncbi:MAG TPA: type II toxin-antitoxin system RelE/ParE family toxin [Stellaceae bacterium]|nr:type II toxin-antitoxin system RelE/ParE family toxin [Stellaceae bacterium]